MSSAVDVVVVFFIFSAVSRMTKAAERATKAHLFFLCAAAGLIDAATAAAAAALSQSLLLSRAITRLISRTRYGIV